MLADPSRPAARHPLMDRHAARTAAAPSHAAWTHAAWTHAAKAHRALTHSAPADAASVLASSGRLGGSARIHGAFARAGLACGHFAAVRRAPVRFAPVRLACVLVAAVAAALSAPSVGGAQAPEVGAVPESTTAPDAVPGPTVELNRLEDAGGGCRLTLVVANPGDQRFEQLKLDLVLFDADGVVARRLAVETGPVRAKKTVVRLFEAADLPCAGIGRLLLNDVVACSGKDGPVPGCLDRLVTASRAAVPFER